MGDRSQGQPSPAKLEYASRGNLMNFLCDEPPQREKDIRLFWERILGLGEALDHTHRYGLWHQDIEPANILICQKLLVCLTGDEPKEFFQDAAHKHSLGRQQRQRHIPQ